MSFLFLLAIVLILVLIPLWIRKPKSKTVQWLGLIIGILFLIIICNLVGWQNH